MMTMTSYTLETSETFGQRGKWIVQPRQHGISNHETPVASEKKWSIMNLTIIELKQIEITHDISILELNFLIWRWVNTYYCIYIYIHVYIYIYM